MDSGGLSERNARDRPPQLQFHTQGNVMDSANDMKAHTGTYSSFIGMLKVVLPVIAAITLLIIVLISS
jgi:hypothetical protein